uniref:SFT2 domain containing 3 n=1 Tax=Maylandia zebra TaxID=106582 RepID=A0A3P9D3X0_9CICH
MADLNRQLQEYLSQSKGGGAKTISQSGSSTAVDLGDPEPVPGSWFGRWSSPWSASTSGQSSGGAAACRGRGRPEPDPCLPGMSRRQRLLASACACRFSALCFGLSALYARCCCSTPASSRYSGRLARCSPSRLPRCSAGPAGWPLASLPPPEPPCTCVLSVVPCTGAEPPQHRADRPGRRLQVAVIAGCLVSLLPGGSAGIRFMGGMAASAIRRTVTGKTMPI